MAAGKKKTVLIVDDAAFMRRVLRVIFEEGGYEVVGEAENGLSGLKKYSELRPDIITMDIAMPVMSGFEAAKAIMEKDDSAKVLIISSGSTLRYVVDAFKAGAAGFIAKPFKEEAILEKAKSLCT